MPVGRTATTQKFQDPGACVGYFVGCSCRNAYGVTRGNRESFFTKVHDPATVEKMIKLFSFRVYMQPGRFTWGDRGMGEALTFIAMNVRMHQFTYLGAVFGAIRFNVADSGLNEHRRFRVTA